MRVAVALFFVLALFCGLSSQVSGALAGKPTCPTCKKNFDPICVTIEDGIHIRTYRNMCELRRYNCIHRVSLKVAFKGACF